jgi:hypothetical protein
MSTLQRAIEIAVAAHAGGTEKLAAAVPYVTHPLALMQSVESVPAKIVAVLHDVLEDTSVTVNDLREAGFSAEVIEGVQAVTRLPGESYADFIVRSAKNPLGREVKLADLQHNFNLPRTLIRPDRPLNDIVRLGRYALSYRFLTHDISEDEYRRAVDDLEAVQAPAARSDRP